jgi:hypothetical protein
MSRPQFITDNLAKASKPIRVFKKMIELQDTNFYEEMREERLASLYSVLFDLFSNIYHNYSFDELWFIAKRMYNRSGVVESMTLLEKYFDLELDVELDSNYNLTIDVSTDVEVFKDFDLGVIQIKELAKDLLYYASATYSVSRASYQVDLLNIIVRVNNISVTPLVDRYYEKDYKGELPEVGSIFVKDY